MKSSLKIFIPTAVFEAAYLFSMQTTHGRVFLCLGAFSTAVAFAIILAFRSQKDSKCETIGIIIFCLIMSGIYFIGAEKFSH